MKKSNQRFCYFTSTSTWTRFFKNEKREVSTRNKPLPSFKNPHFQNEAKCTTFLVKMSLICIRMKNHFHIKGWALNLVLIQRPGGTRKWPRHFRNEKRTGAEMRSAIVSRIVTKDVPLSYWPILSLSLVTVPEVFAKVNSSFSQF